MGSKPTYKFIIKPKKTDNKGKVAVYFIYTYRGKSNELSTKIKINPKDWSNGKLKRTAPNAAKLNHYFRERINNASTIIAQILQEKGSFEWKYFKIKFVGQNDIAFIEACQEIINKRKIKPSSKKAYTAALVSFNKYAPKIKLSSLNKQKIEEFYNLVTIKNSQYTAAYYCKVLESCLSALNKKGYNHKNDLFINVDLNIATQKKADHLSLSELSNIEKAYYEYVENKIIHFEISKAHTHKYYRHIKLLLFMCYTGMRYSDAIATKYNHIYLANEIDQLYAIKKTMQKSRLNKQKTVIIPVIEKLKKLINFEENKDRNDLIFKNYTENPYKPNLFYKKYLSPAFAPNKRITSHSGRHTLGQHYANLGLPIEVLQVILGHSDLKTTQKYSKADLSSMFNNLNTIWGEKKSTQEASLVVEHKTMIVAQNLRKIRLEQGLTLEDLSKKILIQKSQINNYELGKSMPSIKTLLIIGEALKIPLSDILKGIL